jgi:hypothetical protein
MGDLYKLNSTGLCSDSSSLSLVKQEGEPKVFIIGDTTKTAASTILLAFARGVGLPWALFLGSNVVDDTALWILKGGTNLPSWAALQNMNIGRPSFCGPTHPKRNEDTLHITPTLHHSTGLFSTRRRRNPTLLYRLCSSKSLPLNGLKLIERGDMSPQFAIRSFYGRQCNAIQCHTRDRTAGRGNGVYRQGTGRNETRYPNLPHYHQYLS